MLSTFLRGMAMSHAGSALKVKDLHAEYLATLDPSEAAWWPRSRFVSDAIRFGCSLTLVERKQALYFAPVQSPAASL